MAVFGINKHTCSKMKVDVLVDLCIAVVAALEVAEETDHHFVVVFTAELTLAYDFCQRTQVLRQF